MRSFPPILETRCVSSSIGEAQNGRSNAARRFCLIGFLLVLLCPAAGAVDHPANQTEERFIAGLVDRRLYVLAEQYCQDQLQKDHLSSLQRTTLTVALSRTYVAWAKNSPPAEQSGHWNSALRVIEQLLAADEDNSYALLARRQAALVHLDRGTFAHEEAETSQDAAPLLQTARQQLRKSVRLLENLLLDVSRRLDQSNRAKGNQSQFTENQLARLKQQVRGELADALMNQAVCHPDSSPDRINALQKAKEILTSLGAAQHPLKWNSRVQYLACLRLLGEATLFHERAEQYLAEQPPDDIAARIQMQLARQFLKEANFERALKQLNSARPTGRHARAECDLLELEILLSAAKHDETEDAKVWQQQATHLAANIEREHTPYWNRRAESLIGHHVAATSTKQNAEMIARAADGLYRAGKMEESLNLYDRAAEQAGREGHAERALELSHTAAMIEQAEKHYLAASERFLKIAGSTDAPGEAAEAHLMGIYNYAQAIRQQSDPELKTYLKLLQEHLENWPKATTANAARFWLAKMYQSQQQWGKAANLFAEIKPSSKQFPGAIAGAVICYEHDYYELSQRHDSSLPEKATRAADHLERVARTLLNGTLDSSDATTALIAANASARLRMRYTRKGFAQSEQLLQETLKHHMNGNADLLAQLRLLQVYALAGQAGRQAEAKQIFNDLKAPDAQHVLWLLEGLNSLMATVQGTDRVAVAELFLDCFELLEKEQIQIDNNKKLKLELGYVTALEVVGDSQKSLPRIKALAKDNPKNRKIQAAYASLLLEQSDRGGWSDALKKWREIETRSRRTSPEWFEAKYGQARAKYKLGETQQAARIIRMTQVLHPDLGGAAMAKRFRALLALCDESAPPKK
jgi:hypothetical protein